jgi:sortase A
MRQRILGFIIILVIISSMPLILSGCSRKKADTPANTPSFLQRLASLGKVWLGASAQASQPPQPLRPTPPIKPSILVPETSLAVLPDRLVLPALKLDTPVVELGWHPAGSDEGLIFSEWDVARYAAGWHKNSALLEQKGNVVMSAHNNILGAIFRELDQLKKGDEAIVWSGNRQYRYLIDKVMIVPEKHASPEQRAENARWIEPFDDDRLTLVSCWPRNDNTHRIIVVAYRQKDTQVLSP